MGTAIALARLTAKGQIVIPADVRVRHELTPGTQVEFVDEAGVIRLLVRRRVTASDPAAGYGMIRVERPASAAEPRRLSEFDPATLAKPRKALVPLTVVLEVEWVMRGFYDLPRAEFCRAMVHLLGMLHVTVERWEAVRDALAQHQRGLDFAAALHWACSARC